MTKKIVYIAGKYNASTDGGKLKNTNIAIDMAIKVYTELGAYPHVPHLTHWIEKRMDYKGFPPRDNSFWYDFDNLILPKCDILFKISKDGESKGADLEEQLARELRIPVVKSFDELQELIQNT